MASSPTAHRYFASYFERPVLRPFLYLLSKRLSEGHVCLDLESIDNEELIEGGFNKNVNFKKLEKEGLVSDGSSKQPFVLAHNKLYLQRYFHYETQVISCIQNLIGEGERKESERARQLLEEKALIEELFPEEDLDIPQWQLVAVLSAALHQFSIITGGPGTGKTTTVAKLLALKYRIKKDLRVALAAPTGKAAARMGDSLSGAGGDEVTKKKLHEIEPMTVHRLLGWKRNSLYFKHHRDHPVPYDLVIVDESSMIDMALFAKFLSAIDVTTTSVLLLGDKNQLASVEAGSLFGDLCLAQDKLNLFSRDTASFFNVFIQNEEQKLRPEHISRKHHLLSEHVIELQHSYRFNDQGGIGKLSRALMDNKQREIQPFFDNDDEQITTDTTYDEDLFKKVVKGFKRYIQEPDPIRALHKFNNLRVLCAVREGAHGVYELNRKIESYLSSWGEIRKIDDFYEHRPVMVTGNNYELGLFNGDIGLTRKGEDGQLKVCFEDKNGEPKWVIPALLDTAETVFAMTIHKSQGSEFKEVMVVLPEQEGLPLLTRELLYTAVTRAKEKVVLQGRKAVILSAAAKQVRRGSGIIERIH